MQVKDLDGHHHSWNLTGHIARGKLTNKSSFHLNARNIIHDIFPTLQILEEVSIPVRKSETLYLDFYIPLKRLCVEVHGEQHYEFTPFYHTNIMSFFKSQKRDRDKQEWCEINNINYIVLPHFEEDNQWIEKLTNA